VDVLFEILCSELKQIPRDNLLVHAMVVVNTSKYSFCFARIRMFMHVDEYGWLISELKHLSFGSSLFLRQEQIFQFKEYL